MTLWQQLQDVIDRSTPGCFETAPEIDLLDAVEQLAIDEGRAKDEVILSLLNQALQVRRSTDRTHRSWESLSQREKQVAALVCSGLTGRQIAARLVLSPETVKTHVRHILRKFALKSRRDLRNLLGGWDFERWLIEENRVMPANGTIFLKSDESRSYYPDKSESVYEGRE